MGWLKKLFSFAGTAKRSELLRKLAIGMFLVWVAALIDEQIIGPYLCSQDPFKIGCIPGEVTTGFSIEDYIAVILMLIPIAIALIAVMVRRLHDHEKSGWWLLAAFPGIGIFPLVYWFLIRAPKSADNTNA